MEKRDGENKTKKNKQTLRVGVVVAMNRWLETNYIQSQETIPLFTEGRLKASNVKSLQHFEMKKRMWPTQNTESVNI